MTGRMVGVVVARRQRPRPFVPVRRRGRSGGPVVTAGLDDLRSAFAELTAAPRVGAAPDAAQPRPRPDRPGRRGGIDRAVGGRDPARPGVVTTELRDELADCLVYLVALADALGVDVVERRRDPAAQRGRERTAVSGERPLPSRAINGDGRRS